MNKKLLLISALALCSAVGSAQEIKVHETNRKWSPTFDALIQGRTVSRLTAKGVKTQSAETLVRVKITTVAGAAEGVETLCKVAGYESETVNDQVVIATIPAKYIAELAKQTDVLYVDKTQQFRRLMDSVRPDIGADKAQAGTSLDTPYDGTGVIVGVIDQGFEYGHPAFKGAAKRWGSSVKSGSLRTTAPTYDSTDDVGHATHVSNIAIGRKVTGSNYYGVATGAEWLPIASDFSDASILLQVKAIKDYAESQGKPWVLNMSFGSNIGGHDGQSDYDQSMEKFCGKGAIMVAAMGNAGDYNFHASHTFTADDEMVYLYMKPDASYNESKYIVSNILSTAADGKENLTVSPVVYYNGKLLRPTTAQLEKAQFYYEDYINPYSNRQNVYMDGSITQLCKVLSVANSSSCYLMWEIKGKKDVTFHAWVEPEAYPATFEKVTKKVTATGESFTTIKGDTNYTYCDGGASIPSSIGVASYNIRSKFKSLDGYTYTINNGGVNAISSFSSKGPYVIETDMPKPTVAAPGGGILSAISKNSDDFDKDDASNVLKVTDSGKSYYYAEMDGTSMATPVVTGTIAVWLQANPDLTPQDINNIIQLSSRHDTYTGGTTPSWDNSWGYGKIDTYEGLKQAIRLRTAINETFNSPAPITFEQGNKACRILFNNDESYAMVQVVSVSGQVLKQQHIEQPRHGNECVVSLQGLTPGVYMMRVNTTASTATKKIIVK